MSDFRYIDKTSLDQHITGNYGEDRFRILDERTEAERSEMAERKLQIEQRKQREVEQERDAFGVRLIKWLRDATDLVSKGGFDIGLCADLRGGGGDVDFWFPDDDEIEGLVERFKAWDLDQGKKAAERE